MKGLYNEIVVKILIKSILFFCFLAGGFAVHAAEKPISKTFTIGTEDIEDFRPYSEYKKREFRGLGRAILDAFAKKQGYHFIYKTYPIKRRDRMFIAGELDFSYPDNPYWVADLKKNLPVKYVKMLEFTDGALVLPENIGKGVDRVKILGMPLGFTPFPYADLIKSGAIRLLESPNYESLYYQLGNHKIDAAYVDIRVAAYFLSHGDKQNKPKYVYDPSLPHISDYFHLSSFKEPKILDEFQDFMNRNPALIEKLKKEYDF